MNYLRTVVLFLIIFIGFPMVVASAPPFKDRISPARKTLTTSQVLRIAKEAIVAHHDRVDKTVLIVRHRDKEWGVIGVFNGHYDKRGRLWGVPGELVCITIGENGKVTEYLPAGM